MFLKRVLFLLLLLLDISSAKGTPLRDSISLYYLSRMVPMQSDTGKVNILLDYSEALMPFEVDSAAAINDAALLQSRQINYNEGVIRALLNKGKMEYNKGNFMAGIAYFQQALGFCKGKDKKWVFHIYNHIANSYMVHGDYQQAADNYYKALTILQLKDMDVKKANFYASLYVIWSQLGDHNKSMFYLGKAEEYAILEKDSSALCNVLNKKGNVFLESGDLLKAYTFYSDALAISKDCGYKSIEAMAVSNIGYLYFLQGDHAEARAYFRRSYEMSQDPRVNVFHRLSMLYTFGVYYFLLQDYAEAEEIWIRAADKAEKLNASLYRLKPLLGLSTLYARINNFDRASYFQHLYASLKDSVLSAEKLRDINTLEFKYQLAQKEKNLALQQLKIAEQKAAAFRQNILMAVCAVGIVLLILFYGIIKRNNHRKLLLATEQTNTMRKEIELARIKALMEGEEEERKRVALELHDGVGSMLSMAKLNLSVVRDQYGDESDSSGFSEVMELLDRSSSALRGTAHSLMPEILLHGGIENGLQVFLRKLEQTERLHVSYQSYGQPGVLSPAREKQLFSIMREIMHTVIPYAQPKNILFQLNWQEQLLYVTIETDGIVPDVDMTDGESAAKWTLLKKKVEALKGLMTVDNNRGRGTVWDVEFAI